MKVIWTQEAELDRDDVLEFIALDNVAAAIQMDELFSDAAAQLVYFPTMGRLGRIAGTRELIPHESYCIVYEIEDSTIWVLALVHTARQWPPKNADR